MNGIVALLTFVVYVGVVYGQTLLPIYTIYNSATRDSIITATAKDRDMFLMQPSTVNRGSGTLNAAVLPPNDVIGLCTCAVPLFRYNKPNDDHFHTTFNPSHQYPGVGIETDSKTRAYGYYFDKTEGYCVRTSGQCGATVPLNRFYSYSSGDHYYSIDQISPGAGYSLETTECYVWTLGTIVTGVGC